ncbi:MAG: hypothetical protein KIT83_12075 [Bryobacterales bacterium]|nr:hypothetical protein [Bryobacterales bacterium]
MPLWRPSGAEQEWNLTDFQAKVGATEAKVIDGRFDDSPLLLFIAIDFSADLILTESAKESLASALRIAQPAVLAGLLRIPEQPMVIVDPTTNREQFISAMKTLPMSGRAGLFEMVEVVAGVTSPLVREHPVRAAVLYLTDSEISNYREDYTNPVINRSDARDLSRRFPDALIREKVSTLTSNLQRSSIPIFIVHLNYRNDPLNEAYQTGLRRLAESTGGRGVFCRSIAEIPVAIGDMVNSIQAMGMLEVEVPATISGSFTLTLESAIGAVQHRSQFQPPR